MPRALERFWEKVDMTGDCWLWTAGLRGSNGYGAFWHNRRQTPAHRFAYEAEYGPIDGGLLVLHRCDEPKCVRPSHLFLGTQKENQLDMARKGRIGKRLGEMNNKAKLNPEKVREIRALCATGAYRQADIGEQYGVTQRVIWQIIHGKTWSHVT